MDSSEDPEFNSNIGPVDAVLGDLIPQKSKPSMIRPGSSSRRIVSLKVNTPLRHISWDTWTYCIQRKSFGQCLQWWITAINSSSGASVGTRRTHRVQVGHTSKAMGWGEQVQICHSIQCGEARCLLHFPCEGLCGSIEDLPWCHGPKVWPIQDMRQGCWLFITGGAY